VKEILPDVARWEEDGESVVVATVVAARRSTPRPIGSSFAVSSSGALCGSVSGGCVESDVYDKAQEVFESGEPQLVTYGITDDEAWSVGLPCGGEIDVYLERRSDREPSAPAAGERAVLFTVLEGADAGSKLLVTESGATSGDGPETLAELTDDILRKGRNRLLEVEGRRVFAEWYGPPPRVLVYGAVDTAEALSAAAKAIGWRTIVADARARFATRERIPSADELIVGWPDEVLARVEPDHHTAIVVLTHDDKFDVPALVGALATDAFYIGALGSRRNQERRRERLLEAGVAEEELGRISGPCGLDVGAETQEETALSILAEILAVRADRDGGRLRESAQRIHAEIGSRLG
jgi:xanthine dehydrogenase accessory factor